MINNFKNIGHYVLKQSGYYNRIPVIEKRKIFLNHQSLIPRQKNKKGSMTRAICLDFDLEEKKFSFKEDKELDEDLREYFFAFRVGAPRDAKKFFATNNLKYIIKSIFKDSLKYINNKTKSFNKQYDWLNKNISDKYINFLKYIDDTFYIDNGKEHIVDSNKLNKKQKEIFKNIKFEINKNRSKEAKYEEVYLRLMNKIFLDQDSKSDNKLPSIFIIKFNCKYIWEWENLRSSYINLLYYDFIKRFFVESKIDNKICHICNREKEVTGKPPLPMKFYGTTNNLYFQNIKSKNSYRSFSICESCLIDVITGMDYTNNTFSDYLFGINCYIVPVIDFNNEYIGKDYKYITKVLREKGTNYEAEIEKLNYLLKKSKNNNTKFNILFYYTPPASQSFNVLKYISNIEIIDLIKTLEIFIKYNDKYFLNFEEIYNLTINDLRYYLFPSKKSHKNPDPKVYRKNLLDFFEKILNQIQISYKELICNFISIYKKRFHKKDTIQLDLNMAPFKINIFLKILDELNLLKGGDCVEDSNASTEILKMEYKDFFDTHSEVYKNSNIRQGLFLLGTIISKIKNAQHNKNKKRDILSKINYESLSARRVPSLFNQIKEFSVIYKDEIYNEKGIWANISDRLQNIKNSHMKNDEVIFYILSGLSFEDYLRIKKSIEKK